MMFSKASVHTLGMALVAAGLLAACGGGDDYIEPVVPPAVAASVPDSALASSSAYTQFVSQTATASSETSEPLTASNVNVPPSSETDEPVSVS